MAEPTSLDLVEEALDNLVNQFARPLDCLRELVQNSMDAGSPRVDIYVEWIEDPSDPLKGVVAIHVRDHGDGMDEAIIDQQLTRMFSSTKEGDLTKIGQFGIGFTSIFALKPAAVLLKTGRNGQSWELVFHPDRSFDKTRSDHPFEGTHITLFKEIMAEHLTQMVQECRWTLFYWCEHSDVSVFFEDRTRLNQESRPVATDPFAAFAAPTSTASNIEQVTRALTLESELQFKHQSGQATIILGLAQEPRYSFYNSGLTLVNTQSPEVLGAWAHRMSHLSLKIKSPLLEHTLTRDNVLQDAHWEEVMMSAAQGSEQLRSLLFSQIERCFEAKRLAHLLDFAAQETSATENKVSEAEKGQVFFPTMGGDRISWDALKTQSTQTGCILIGCACTQTLEHLAAAGIQVLVDGAGTRQFLTQMADFADFELQAADSVYVLPSLIPTERLTSPQRQLLENTAVLLGSVLKQGPELYLGTISQDQLPSACLAIPGPFGSGLYKLGTGSEKSWWPWGQKHEWLINQSHPTWASYMALAAIRPHLAAAGLAQILMVEVGAHDSEDFSRLLESAITGGDQRP